jgi:hypothetical protein
VVEGPDPNSMVASLPNPTIPLRSGPTLFTKLELCVEEKEDHSQKTKTEATIPHVGFIIFPSNWCILLNKTGNLPYFNLLLFRIEINHLLANRPKKDTSAPTLP